jgi:hypothetical protein
VHKASSGALTLAKRVESVLGVNPGTAGEIVVAFDLARLADPPPRPRRRRA